MLRYIGKEEQEILNRVLEGQQLWYHGADFVRRFEEEFAKHLGVRYVLAVNSGTSALEAAVAACAIKPGDEVICTAYSFIASSVAVVALNGVPVFADVDPRTLCLDPEDIERKITKRTKAVIVVHIHGQPADMDRILRVASRNSLYVIEDCAQAYDAYYRGKKVGTLGDIAAFSLQQSKHITTGEGGLVVTDDEEMYRRAYMFSDVGMIYDWEKPEPEMRNFVFGHNFRMTQLQGGVGLAQLPKIGEFNERRRRLVEIIEEELQGAPGVILAYAYPGTQPNYWVYPIRFDESEIGLTRDEIIRLCKEEEGVSLGFQELPSYLQPVYREMNEKRQTSLGHPLPEYVRYEAGVCPKLEAEYKRFITIHVHQGIEPESVRARVCAIRKVIERHRRKRG